MMTNWTSVQALAGVSEKIFRRHRERLAIVYIRQPVRFSKSSVCEIGRLAWHWSIGRSISAGRGIPFAVDGGDLGRSGASIEGRRFPAFDLVAEVGLGNVGLVLGVEMSRLARSCRDWHQLEICALFDTLLPTPMGSMIRPSSADCACCWG